MSEHPVPKLVDLLRRRLEQIEVLTLLFGGMTLLINNLREVAGLFPAWNRDRRRYFFIVLQSNFHKMPDEISNYWKTFDRLVGRHGVVTILPHSDTADFLDEIASKGWREEALQLLQGMPAVLILEQPFEDFDPTIDRWVHVSFRGYLTELGEPKRLELGDFFYFLQTTIQGKSDLINEMIERTRREKRERLLKEADGVIEAKPGVGGFSIDLKKAIRLFQQYLE